MLPAPLLDYAAAVHAAFSTALTAPAPRRWRRLGFGVVFLTVLPTAWLAGQLGLLLDRVLYPRVGREPLVAPVFVVGNHRTGSTFLHRLLSADAAQFATFRLFELVLPSVTQKRMVHTLGRLDGVVGGPLAAVVRWADARWATDYREVHPMGFSLAEEDDFVMFFRCASGAMWETFPDVPRLRRHFWSDTEMAREEQDALLAFYADLARRQHFHRGGRTWLAKNPLFSTRVRGLRRTFPDARFVYLVRDPRRVVASTASLLDTALTGIGALRSREHLLEMVHEICLYMYDDTLAHLDDLPPERCVVVRQEDLVADLDGTVASLLDQLGLEHSAAIRDAVQQARARGPRSGHRYTLADFGLSETDVDARYAHVRARFGYAPTSDAGG